MKLEKVYTLNIDEFNNGEHRVVLTTAHGYDSAVPHNHNFIEMVYVKKGSAYNYVNEKKVAIKQGDLIVMANKEIIHFIKPVDPDNFEIYNLLIPYDLFDVKLDRIDSTIVFSNNTINVLQEIINNIYVEQNDKRPGYKNIINACALMLLQLVSRYCSTLSYYGKKKKENNYDYIELAKQYIDENYMKHISIDDIAFVCGCSKNYLQELFKKKSFKSMKQYLMSVRIKNSTHLLLKSDKTIEEISEMCGFCDIKYFYKLFYDEYNMTPSVYRKKFAI